ncbi:hypothetical protein BDZ85DRAFT_264500 [Elsinoe ampelina]|uniref:Uncharacterized protein n=1 Tax=Elsinoe ampelina TaxID=302913 RepID=A0A6A6G7V8_9PEZI|nr:hypothetical protein BDZ85DRAFT_264500 [Elsinoe ampelina]
MLPFSVKVKPQCLALTLVTACFIFADMSACHHSRSSSILLALHMLSRLYKYVQG